MVRKQVLPSLLPGLCPWISGLALQAIPEWLVRI